MLRFRFFPTTHGLDLLIPLAIAGHHGTTRTKILPANKIPQTYTEPPNVVHRNLVSVELTRINAVTDSEVCT